MTLAPCLLGHFFPSFLTDRIPEFERHVEEEEEGDDRYTYLFSFSHLQKATSLRLFLCKFHPEGSPLPSSLSSCAFAHSSPAAVVPVDSAVQWWSLTARGRTATPRIKLHLGFYGARSRDIMSFALLAPTRTGKRIHSCREKNPCN